MLDKPLPGFSAVYGADSIVDLYINTTDLHSFTSSASDQDFTLYGSVTIQFWPRFNGTTELAVEVDLIDVHFTGGIAVDGYYASANITKFRVDKIVVPVSTLGFISAAKLKLELNTASILVVPTLNAKLQEYRVPIPSDIFGIFTLTDYFLTYADGYIFAGATPTFIAPSVPQLEVNEALAIKFEQF